MCLHLGEISKGHTYMEACRSRGGMAPGRAVRACIAVGAVRAFGALYWVQMCVQRGVADAELGEDACLGSGEAFGEFRVFGRWEVAIHALVSLVAR